MFRAEEFRLYEPQNRGDESLNAKRLAVRQKLQTIGEAAKKELAKLGLGLERRESLHHPFSLNHNRVVAQWTSLFRDAKARKEFSRMVGPDLGKDVDPGNANLAFFVAINEDGIDFGLRLGELAWYDAQNFVNRCAKDDAARAAWTELLHRAPGFALRIHDWETRYATATLNRDQALEIFKYFQIGKHRLGIVQTIPKDDPRAASADFCGIACAGLAALAPAYQSMAWHPNNNFLMKGGAGFVS